MNIYMSDQPVFRKRQRKEGTFEEERGGRKMGWNVFRRAVNTVTRSLGFIQIKWRSIKGY